MQQTHDPSVGQTRQFTRTSLLLRQGCLQGTSESMPNTILNKCIGAVGTPRAFGLKSVYNARTPTHTETSLSRHTLPHARDRPQHPIQSIHQPHRTSALSVTSDAPRLNTYPSGCACAAGVDTTAVLKTDLPVHTLAPHDDFTPRKHSVHRCLQRPNRCVELLRVVLSVTNIAIITQTHRNLQLPR